MVKRIIKFMRMSRIFSLFTVMSLICALAISAPQGMVQLSAARSVPILRGVVFDVNDPLKIEFIYDKAAEGVLKERLDNAINYFFTALTVDEKDLWVNLSPYEPDRIVEANIEKSSLGVELLAQDYHLKQLTSSLTHPSTTKGKEYWDSKFSSANESSNKIWITPKNIEIYEKDNTCLISSAGLDVSAEDFDSAVKKLLPEISKEVNGGKNFESLRDIYHSIILASWFKSKFKDSIYSAYINQNKITNRDVVNLIAKDKIYNLYLKSNKKGVYDLTQKVYDRNLNKKIKRNYVSGGASFIDVSKEIENTNIVPKFSAGKVAVICSAVNNLDNTVALENEDIYMDNIRKGALEALIDAQINPQRALKIVKGIKRSRINAQRELQTHYVMNEELDGQKPEDYRYLSISTGGTNVRFGLLDGNNLILAESGIKWADVPELGGNITGTGYEGKAMDDYAETVITYIIQNAQKFLIDNSIDTESIKTISWGLPCNVNKEGTIAGHEFKNPNAPFFNYPFVDVAMDILPEYGLVNIETLSIMNDSVASLKGEQNAPKGGLRDENGAPVRGMISIVGTGLNICIDGLNTEAGHNLVVEIDDDEIANVVWARPKAMGLHPLDIKKTDEIIIKASVDVGRYYVDEAKRDLRIFKEKYPTFPVIDVNMSDFEDWLSGRAINERVVANMEKALSGAPNYSQSEVQDYIAIRDAAEAIRKEGKALDINPILTILASKGNDVAINWIRKVSFEMGKVYGEFFRNHIDDPAIENLVLVSSINEHMGKSVSSSTLRNTLDSRTPYGGVKFDAVTAAAASKEVSQNTDNQTIFSDAYGLDFEVSQIIDYDLATSL